MNWISMEPAFGGVALFLDLFLGGLLILAATGLLVGGMRRMPAAARHLVWAMALGALLLLPVLVSWMPRVNLGMIEAPTWMPSSSPIEMPAMEPGTAAWVPAPFPSADRPGGETGIVWELPESTGWGRTEAVAPRPLEEAATTDIFSAWAPYLTELRQAHWSVWVVGIWGLVGGLIVTWVLMGLGGVWWITHRARTVTDAEWLDLCDELADRLFVYQQVRLLTSPAIASPMTWGAIRPVILLPVDADDWPVERRRSVLMHELAHIKRGDILTHFIAQLGCALHWFNPFSWHALKRMRIEQEKACDDLVLANGTRASDYASHLLAIARSMRTSWASPLNAISMAKPSQLEGRVVDILDPDRTRRTLGLSNGILTAVIGLAVILPLAALTPWQMKDEDATVPSAFEKSPDWAVTWTPPEVVPDEESISEAVEKPSIALFEPVIARVAGKITVAPADTSEEAKRARAKAIQALREALKDEDEEIRRQAAIMLAQMGDKGSAGAFLELLETDSDANVRRHAILALNEIHSEEAMQAILVALSDEDAGVRRHALMVLSDYRHPQAAGAMLRMLDDPDADIRRMAIMGLANQDSEESNRALVRLLDDPDADVRRFAIMTLAEHRNSETLPALMKALDDADADVRRMAVMAISQYGNDEALPALRKALQDRDPGVRRHALMAIGELGGEASIDVLIEVLDNDEDPEIRRFAVMALGEIGDIRAVDALTRALKDENKEVRRHAAFALSNLNYGERPRSGSRDEFGAALYLDTIRNAEQREQARQKLAVLQEYMVQEAQQKNMKAQLQQMNQNALQLQSDQALLAKRLVSAETLQKEALKRRVENVALQRKQLDLEMNQVAMSLDRIREATARQKMLLNDKNTIEELAKIARDNRGSQVCQVVVSLLESQDSVRARTEAKTLQCEKE